MSASLLALRLLRHPRGARCLSSGSRLGSATRSESWSFLPILNITKGLPAVYHTEPTASAFRAIIDMVKMRSGSLMVSKGSELYGIVTERDVLDKLPFAIGSSRKLKVTDLMTPKSSLITAPPSFTLDQCVKAMHAGTFRHLPIVEGTGVRAVISMRDIAQHVASALAKAPVGQPTTVRELMEAKGGPSCVELPSSSSVGAAVEMMRSTRAGSILISSSEGFGIITERDYLTKVAVYDEANPHDIPVTDIMTTSPYVKTVSATGRISDCLSLMVAGGFRHLPVVDKAEVVGVISMRDILHYFLK